MKSNQNLLMLIAVIALVALPLWMVQKSAHDADGEKVAIFKGTDDQAKDVISKIAPAYKPWLKPFMEPPSGEVESLLFALQAALGAGFIGYYLGVVRTRAKMEKSAQKDAKC